MGPGRTSRRAWYFQTLVIYIRINHKHTLALYVFQRLFQGSHEHWKTWKITKKSSMHGKIMEFEKKLKNHGKIMEFCEVIYVFDCLFSGNW